MLGKRLPDEEGTHVRRTWKAWVLLQRAPVPTSLTSNKYHNQAHIDDKKSTYSSSDADVIFRKDGGFARTVGSDNVKIVNKKMFVRTNEHGEALTEEGKEAIRLQLKEPSNQDENKFVIVYIPPNFKSRILLFIYLLWLSCAIGIFVAFVSPCEFSPFFLSLLV